jgi:hypothetical protein
MFRVAVSSLSVAVLVCISGCQSSEPAPASQPQAQASPRTQASSAAPTPAQPAAQSSMLSPSPLESQSVATLEATTVIEAWLKLLDQGKYAESWDQTGKWFKETAPKQAWCQQTAAIRTSFGPVVSRTFKQSKYATKVWKQPNAQYITIQYDTLFKNQGRGVEEVTAIREADGKWRSLGYYVTALPPSAP